LKRPRDVQGFAIIVLKWLKVRQTNTVRLVRFRFKIANKL